MKPRIDKRKDRPRPNARSVTVNSLLTIDSVKEAIEYLRVHETEITKMVCVFFTRNDAVNWSVTRDIQVSEAVFMLERVKHVLLNEMDNQGEEL